MGDSRKWAAEYEDDLYSMMNAVVDHGVAHNLALDIKSLMDFSENSPLTVKQRNDIERSIDSLLSALADIVGIDLKMTDVNMRDVLGKI